MVDKSIIEKKILEFGQTETAKRRMSAYIKSLTDGDGKLASGQNIVTIDKMNKMADMLVGFIKSRMPESIRSVANTLTHTHPVRKRDGSYEITLKFDQSQLHRESLDPYEYPDGVDNIVALLNKGYNAKNHVYGWWDGHKASGEALFRSGMLSSESAFIRSLKQRDPLYFIESAVERFMKIYSGNYNVNILIGSDYIK